MRSQPACKSRRPQCAAPAHPRCSVSECSRSEGSTWAHDRPQDRLHQSRNMGALWRFVADVGRRCHNDLIDTENAAILDVEASRAIRQADVGASRTMLARTAERFGLTPKRVIADGAYGSAHNLAWLVKQRKIEPYISVFDKSQRTDGTFSRCSRFRPQLDAKKRPTHALATAIRSSNKPMLLRMAVALNKANNLIQILLPLTNDAHVNRSRRHHRDVCRESVKNADL